MRSRRMLQAVDLIARVTALKPLWQTQSSKLIEQALPWSGGREHLVETQCRFQQKPSPWHGHPVSGESGLCNLSIAEQTHSDPSMSTCSTCAGTEVGTVAQLIRIRDTRLANSLLISFWL
jgi:hypothetical protein